MRKYLAILGAIALLCLFVSPVMAGGIINKSNLSSDYFRSLTRNAATDAADIIAYNPAGVMKLANGFYTKVDAMYITKDYTNTVPDVNPVTFAGEDGYFMSDEPSIVPGLFTVYKKDKWAGFFAVTIPGGGGEVEFANGSAYTSLIGLNFGTLNPAFTGIDSHYIEGNSFDIGYTLGAAVEVNDVFSFAGGLRYINATQEFKGNIVLTTPGPTVRYDVDIEREATGLGFFVGANIAPTEKLNMGFLYMTNTPLEFDATTTDTSPGAAISTQAGWANGTSRREDLPGLLGFGIAYKCDFGIRTELAYTLYLESDAELSSASGRWDNAGNSYDLGLSLEYDFNPQWKVSLGYMITRLKDMDPEELLPLAPELDANTIGFGVVYQPNDRWRFNAGYTNVDYDEVTTTAVGTNSPPGTTLDKHSIAYSLGIQYRFF